MVAWKASIRDVAARAGVSITTVSHVLNDVSHARVAEEIRARVQVAAEQLSYRPSTMARGLRMQQTRIIGLISDTITTTPFAFEMILGAQDVALEQGWTLLLLNTESDPEAERRAIRAILDHQAEGVIYATMYHRVVEFPADLRALPTVLLDAECDDPNIPSVVPDEYRGARAAVEHLISLGHRRIGYVSNHDDIPATRDRLRAYHNALEDAGIAVDDSSVAMNKPDSSGGYHAAIDLIPERDAGLSIHMSWTARSSRGNRSPHRFPTPIPEQQKRPLVSDHLCLHVRNGVVTAVEASGPHCQTRTVH